MNNEELLTRKELSDSSNWVEIRRRLLDYLTEQSGNEIFVDKYAKGLLYGIKIVDTWKDDYFKAVKKEKERKGEL